MSRRLLAAACAAAALACMTVGALLPAGALATPSVGLKATLTPEILGHATTIRLDMQLAPGGGELVPPPLTAAQLRYPAGMEVTLSGLGIEACPETTLLLAGPEGCPADSVMGRGRAGAEIPLAGEVVRETARIAIVRGAEQEGDVTLLLVVYHEPALSAQIVLPTVLLPAAKPFGGSLEIHAPLVSTVPEGPDLSVSDIELVLGPRNLVYSERAHGRLVHYTPAGIPLPERCPRGGFRFALQMEFVDGSRAAASTAVACPRRPRRKRAGSHP